MILQQKFRLFVKMQKVIIDTNVIVSSLIQKSYPYRIVFGLLIEGKILLCISPQLIAEYYAVLTRPKFAQFQEFSVKAKIVLALIDKEGNMLHSEYSA